MNSQNKLPPELPAYSLERLAACWGYTEDDLFEFAHADLLAFAVRAKRAAGNYITGERWDNADYFLLKNVDVLTISRNRENESAPQPISKVLLAHPDLSTHEIELSEPTVFYRGDIRVLRNEAKRFEKANKSFLSTQSANYTNNSSKLAEKKCKEWLRSLMANGAEKTGSKTKYFEMALGSFEDLSRRGFDRAWDQAIDQTGAHHWQTPGRRKKS